MNFKNVLKQVKTGGLSVFLLSLMVSPALAQTTGYQIFSNPAKFRDVNTLLQSIMGVVFWGLVVVAVGLIIYAGFLFATAAGDDEKIKTATKTITFAVVGIVVAFFAVMIVDVVVKYISKDQQGIIINGALQFLLA